MKATSFDMFINPKKCRKKVYIYFRNIANITEYTTIIILFFFLFILSMIMSQRFSISESLEDYYDKVVVDLRGNPTKCLVKRIVYKY